MRNSIHYLIAAILITSSILTTLPLLAASTILKNNDLKRLPQFCTAKTRSHAVSTSEVNYWKQKLGSSFIDIHHYCFAMHYQIIAQQADNKIEQKYYLERVIGNTNYILENARSYSDPNYYNSSAESVGFSKYMLLRMLTEAYIGLGNEQEAQNSILRLLEEQQGNISAQLYAFDFYFERSMYSQCESIISKINQSVSSHKGINRRKDRLAKAIESSLK